MSVRLRFTLGNDLESFPIPFWVESMKFEGNDIPLRFNKGDIISGSRLKNGSHRLQLNLSKTMVAFNLGAATEFHHVGRALMIQVGDCDHSSVWFDSYELGVIQVQHKNVQTVSLKKDDQCAVYPKSPDDIFYLTLPTSKVHIRFSKNWKAEVIG